MELTYEELKNVEAMVALVRAMRAERDEALDDRRRALKRADALTLETQTCDEAVALVELVRAARAERDDLRVALKDTAARLQAYVDTGQTPEMVTKTVTQMKAIGEQSRTLIAQGSTSNMISLVRALTTLKP